MLAEDLLVGGESIADFMGWNRRRVFYLADKGELPIFKIGGVLHARKSTLIRWIEEKEASNFQQESSDERPG